MSKNLPDMTGQKFGRWTVLELANKDQKGETQYKCRCECGTERVLRRTSLTSGNSKSCGCLSRDLFLSREVTHGETKTRLYKIWAGIVQRCCNPKGRYEWEKYGGRGISLCDEWRKSFERFRDWALANGYRDDLSIDRIDVNGNYEPSNCRWATAYEQSNNKRTSHFITFQGETKTVKEFADIHGIPYSCLYTRIRNGWSADAAITTPSKGRKRA